MRSEREGEKTRVKIFGSKLLQWNFCKKTLLVPATISFPITKVEREVKKKWDRKTFFTGELLFPRFFSRVQGTVTHNKGRQKCHVKKKMVR